MNNNMFIEVSTLQSNIGDRPLSLAIHLRTIGRLLTDSPAMYDWAKASSCNCGLLARSIMGVTVQQLNKMKSPMVQGAWRGYLCLKVNNTWTRMAADYCPLTGEPMTEVFKQLAAAGLLSTDYAHLEYLSHSQIDTCYNLDYTIPGHVAVYMAKWASLIEAFHAAQQVSEETLNQIETRPLISTTS